MKRLIWALPILLLAISASAFADSITIYLSPNDGSGDNFGFSLIQPGFVVGFGGGTPYDFFNDQGYAPGSIFNGATGVFFSSGSVQFGDNTYALSGVPSPGSLVLTNFTFPTNGQNFSILVQADFSTSAYYWDDNAGQYQTINIGGSAPGTMTFTWYPSAGLYVANPAVFRSATVAPEPGTLGLMGTGLISLFVLARRRFRANNQRARA